jgi:thimet oligopeptidase
MLTADLDPAKFHADATARLDQARAALEAFLALPADAPFQSVVESFDAIGRPLDRVRGAAGLASQTHPNEAVRNVAQTIVQEISSFATDLSLHRGVYERVAALDLEQAPGPQERRLVANAVRDFRRGGVDRDDATRERIKQLSDELVRIGQEFDLNIAADTRSIAISEGRAGLAGLPQDYIDAHAPNERGEVVITTDPTDYVPFMTYAANGELRRRLQFEYFNRATPRNLEVLGELMRTRHALATLLGYASWADYVTEDKMIKSSAKAREFIARVERASRSRMQAEVAELLEFKRASDPDATVIHEWERAYLLEKVKSTRLRFESQSVRPYFAYRAVRDGVLATSAALFGVEFRRNETQPRWHASVECYDVVDSGAVVARVFLDMHPRANKFKHAAMFDLTTGVGDDPPQACLVCNFPEPTESDPALLLHRDVETFFHEFGHLLHHLFAGRQRYLAFAGIATEWDFVETPSQLYEEWAWDAGVLQRFARHHQTGEPIPSELVARMRAADEYGKGLHVAVQMYFARLSLELFDRDPASVDATAHAIALKREVLPFPHEAGTHFHASFGHLNGYSATYYTYMWSLVIAKDFLGRFHGRLMDTREAQRYRSTILSAGGSKDAAELVRDYLGRDYATDAFEAWLNA